MRERWRVSAPTADSVAAAPRDGDRVGRELSLLRDRVVTERYGAMRLGVDP